MSDLERRPAPCNLHGEALAEIRAVLNELVRRVGVQNGRVDKLEAAFTRVSEISAVHQALMEHNRTSADEIAERVDKLEPLVTANRSALDKQAGGKESTMDTIQRWALLVGIAGTLAGVWLKH